MKTILVLIVAAGLYGLTATQDVVGIEKDARAWFKKGKNALSDQLSRYKNENIAKNIILFIGDGMGVSTVTAARILDGQLKGKPGEENQFYFENFDDVAFSKTITIKQQSGQQILAVLVQPNTVEWGFKKQTVRTLQCVVMLTVTFKKNGRNGTFTADTWYCGGLGSEGPLLYPHLNPRRETPKTYNIDRQVPDSAGTATALLCGVKTNIGVLGLDGYSVYGDCAASASAEKLSSLLQWAQAAGKRTGIVTTSRITHATPAAAYANSPSRDWEGDVNMSDEDAPCKDIARQLIEDNKNINVILGGGRKYFLPNDVQDPETKSIDKQQRADGRNLIKDWLDDKKDNGKTAEFVWNRDQFTNLTDNVEYLLGLFNPSHMDYDLERQEYGEKSEPSLAEMVDRALEILKEGDEGFFLLAEGARIDHGHHLNQAKKALYDVIALDKAVEVAKRHTSWKDTLMLVTADHSHPFNVVGYPSRGRDILDLNDFPSTASDGKPFTTILYGNGPGYTSPREDLSASDTKADNFMFQSAVPLYESTHGGEDVAIYAKGSMSHLVNGIQEQSYVAHVAAYAACIGPYGSGNHKKNCKSRTPMVEV